MRARCAREEGEGEVPDTCRAFLTYNCKGTDGLSQHRQHIKVQIPASRGPPLPHGPPLSHEQSHGHGRSPTHAHTHTHTCTYGSHTHTHTYTPGRRGWTAALGGTSPTRQRCRGRPTHAPEVVRTGVPVGWVRNKGLGRKDVHHRTQHHTKGMQMHGTAPYCTLANPPSPPLAHSHTCTHQPSVHCIRCLCT